MGGMTLRDHLKKRRIGPGEAAKELGVTRQAVHRYLRGQRPKVAMIFKIEEWSRGDVSREDLLGKSPVRASRRRRIETPKQAG